MTDICRADGSAITEYFAQGTVPTEPCTNHYGSLFDTGLVCAMTGQKATNTCPYAYEGEATAEGFCEHSQINGVSAQDYFNLLQAQAAGLLPGVDPATLDPEAAAAAAAAAADPAAQQALLLQQQAAAAQALQAQQQQALLNALQGLPAQ